MPIQLSIMQPTGVAATYHVATGGGFGKTSLTTSINSYLSQTAYAAGSSPLMTTSIDCSAVMPSVATNPPTGATIEQVVFGIVEGFAIVQQTPNPQSTTANPLPPINGMFYGGNLAA